jgi:hypothetical protein
VLVRLDVSSTLGLSRNTRDDELLASDFSVGIDENLLRYEANYSLDRGDILEFGEPGTANAGTPKRFLAQQLGQNVSLRLPGLAGSPLTLGVTSEIRNDWLVSGYTQSLEQRAGLNWSPGTADVDVKWSANGMSYGPSAALTCNIMSSVRLPTHERENYSEGVRLSGAECVVAADGTAYAGLATQTWGVGYAWNRPRRKSEAFVSVIEPVRTQADGFRAIEPGYKLDLSHRRDFGPISTRTVVSLRQPPSWDAVAVDGGVYDAAEPAWSTHASLTWNLPRASVSANWANGVDRLWFTPDVGTRADRFGLALNLSSWMEGLLPNASPRFAMNWNWSQVRLPDDQAAGVNALQLDLALMF